jgi:hypothetical protein
MRATVGASNGEAARTSNVQLAGKPAQGKGAISVDVCSMVVEPVNAMS